MSTTTRRIDVQEIGQTLVEMIQTNQLALEVRVELVKEIFVVQLLTEKLSYEEEDQFYASRCAAPTGVSGC